MEPQINEFESVIAPLKKVTPLSKYLAMVLFIILPFIGGWIGYSLAPEKVVVMEKVVVKEVAVERDVAVETVNILTNNDPGLKIHQDDDLGISFKYPASWGEVTINNEKGTCLQNYTADDCNFRTLLFKDTSNDALFLTAETKGHQSNPVGRGGFWGDIAGDVGPEYLAECEEATNCSLYRNKKGLVFAVYEADPPPEEMGYRPKRYVVYNPDSQYYGLVLSSIRMSSYTPDVDRIFQETVIDTFSFLSRQ